MNKDFIRAILFSIILMFVIVPILVSANRKLEQSRIDEINYQKKIIAELAEYEARVKAEKIKEDIIYLTGKFDPSKKEDFILIPLKYTLQGNQMYLRKEAYEAFLQMHDAATADFINLKIASATRNFDYQKNLWNNKWTGVTIVNGQNLSTAIQDELKRFNKILEYSAAPGTSRHHWGTDIDINGAEIFYFNSLLGAAEYEWLTKNARNFGFCQTYNKKSLVRTAGHNEEKWHWSYLPLARDFTQRYKELIKDEDITGFLGDEFVPELDLINNYVLSINPECI